MDMEKLLIFVEDNNVVYLKLMGDEEFFFEFIVGIYGVFIDGEYLFC